jgi:hypothetical protein
MIRHNGPEVFQTPVRDYPTSASVANLLRFSICCRGSRCDRFSMKVLRIFVYCSVAAVILGVFNVWGGLQLYDAARSYNWPHVTGRVISSGARSKLMKGRHGEFIAHWPDVQYEYVVGDRRDAPLWPLIATIAFCRLRSSVSTLSLVRGVYCPAE